MDLRRIDISQRDYSPTVLIIPIALLCALIFANPVPLVGGYTDDFKYLVGAQCLDCLPTNHWERRFAIVWPTGIAIHLFGQNLWSVMIFPVAAAIAAVVLVFKMVEARYGRKAALIACCVMVLTPVFTERSTRIAIDIVELAFLLASVFLLQRHKGHFWSGAMLALAVLCRPTELAALPMVAALAWWQNKKQIGWFALGFMAPLAIEASAYLLATGDPLYSWKLSLNHVQTWKGSLDQVRFGEFLSPGVDTTKSPLFNPDYIGGWMPTAKIEAHWTVQGLINLLVTPEAGITLTTALFLVALEWKRLDRVQLALIAAAALYFGALTYGFAVDPRARMFLPVVVIASVLLGTLGARKMEWPRSILPPLFFLVILIVGIYKMLDRIDFGPDAEKANELLKRGSYQLTRNTQERLSLLRQDFPHGGKDLIEIDDRCPIMLQDRWLHIRVRNLCIYRQAPPLPPYQHFPMRNAIPALDPLTQIKVARVR
jgi:hypothetical protein